MVDHVEVEVSAGSVEMVDAVFDVGRSVFTQADPAFGAVLLLQLKKLIIKTSKRQLIQFCNSYEPVLINP